VVLFYKKVEIFLFISIQLTSYAFVGPCKQARNKLEGGYRRYAKRGQVQFLQFTLQDVCSSRKLPLLHNRPCTKVWCLMASNVRCRQLVHGCGTLYSAHLSVLAQWVSYKPWVVRFCPQRDVEFTYVFGTVCWGVFQNTLSNPCIHVNSQTNLHRQT
jgi:hypothetical protein